MPVLWLVFALISMGLTVNSLSTEQSEDKPTLRFNASGKFKIAQFTDLHWDENSVNKFITKEVILHVLKTEKPDLAIVTGDVVTEAPAKEGWVSIAKIFEAARTPWALTLGNHDDETGITRSEIFKLLKGKPYFLGETGPTIGGSGNYVLPIQSHTNSTVKSLVYCLDTHNKPSIHKYGHYDWVRFDQLKWYREQSEKYTAQNSVRPLPALAFFHIPLIEFNQVIGKDGTLGHAREGIASADINAGLFASFLEKQDVMGVFVGHNHENDYIGTHFDLALAFGRTTGIDAYGRLERGGRIIELYEDKFQFDTWIRTRKGKELMYYYPSGLSEQDEETMHYWPAKSVVPTGKGLRYTYYEGGRLKQIADIEHNARLVSTGKIEGISLRPAMARDSFALVFNGLIQIPERGVYRFYTYSDDGSRLTINGQVVVNNDGSHSAKRRDGKIALEKGYHDIELIYFDDYMGEMLEVGYASRHIREQLIDSNMLFFLE